MRLTLSAAAVSIALSAPAMAADIGEAHLANGSELLTFCARSTGHTQSACMGYIVGVSDALISDLIRDTKAPVKAPWSISLAIGPSPAPTTYITATAPSI